MRIGGKLVIFLCKSASPPNAEMNQQLYWKRKQVDFKTVEVEAG